jgi:predicted alpha/beta-hydrolase family hydrolase
MPFSGHPFRAPVMKITQGPSPAATKPCSVSGGQPPSSPRLCRTMSELSARSGGQRAATIVCVTTLHVGTPHGLAKAHLHTVDEPRAALVLGHGAAGGVASRDLEAVTAVAGAQGVSVALVEQPYKVAGRRSPAPARQLDVAWTTVVDHLLEGELRGLPLLVGGRSLGARVACRTAKATGADAVLCLAFPLHAPGRSGVAASRLHELDEVTVPTLVVQGERDPFGMPPAGARRTVVQVPGDHSLKADLDAVATAVRTWLSGVLARS